MKLYLTGIKSYQLDLGISCTAFSDPRLARTIPGIKRDHNEPERRMRTPLTRPCLKLIIHHLSPINYNDTATRAAFTLALAGFLRVGEFTYKESDRDVRHAKTLVHTHGPLRSAQTQHRGYATITHHS